MSSLRFQCAEAEAKFLQSKALRCRDLHFCNRAAGVLRAGLLVGPALGLPRSALLAALLVGSTAAAIIAWRPSIVPQGLLHPVELALDTLQPLFACALFHRLYPAVPGAGPLCSLACVLAGNGVLALAVRAKTSPLPFRWQLPAVVATGTALLAHTPSFCGSALLQHGFRTLHTLLRCLLPLLAPGFIDIMPPHGFAALPAPAPEADADGAALCAAYQAPSVLLGCAALACHLYAAEARQRKAFLAAGVASRPRTVT